MRFLLRETSDSEGTLPQIRVCVCPMQSRSTKGLVDSDISILRVVIFILYEYPYMGVLYKNKKNILTDNDYRLTIERGIGKCRSAISIRMYGCWALILQKLYPIDLDETYKFGRALHHKPMVKIVNNKNKTGSRSYKFSKMQDFFSQVQLFQIGWNSAS